MYVGGAYYFDKLNFFEKIIVKKIGKVKETLEEISLDKIDKLLL